jgi:hypothetical protein
MRYSAPEELGRYGSVYVSARGGDVAMSCAGRIQWERKQGLMVLVVTLFGPPDDSVPADCDDFAAGLPLPPPRPEDVDEALKLEAVRVLDEVIRRARPRRLYVPLGLGEQPGRRLAHEAGLRTFQRGVERDILLYEERPDVFVSGSVRIRLGEIGARLPPAASRVAGEAGLARYLLRLHTVPQVREGSGWSERVRWTRLATRQWLAARAWRPEKAFGPRLQPVLHRADAGSVASVLQSVRAQASQRGAFEGAGDRFLGFAADYTRRLGAQGYAERLWLLLPERDEEHGAPAGARPPVSRG